ncbi:WhiB family transcriptional regulator [Streptacidiphilus monticola]
MAARRHPRMLALRTPSSPARFHQALTVTAPPDSELPGALCRQVAPDVFFPEPDDAEGVALAKTVCGYCPAQNACLTAALKRDERIGVRGGTTPPSGTPCSAASVAAAPWRLHRPRRLRRTALRRLPHRPYGGERRPARRTRRTVLAPPARAAHPPPSFGPYQRPGTEAA